MRKILALAILLAPAAAPAADAGKEAGMTHTETGYFEVRFPAGWEKTEGAFGLSDSEKKVYGAEVSGARDADGLAPRISARYYAPGNLLHKTAEKFIRTHSRPALGAALDGQQYGPVKKGLAGKHYARVFDRKIFEFTPQESLNPKKIAVYEKFHVVPVKDGFFVLRYTAPAAAAKTHMKAYEAAVASFKPLNR
ncbi:MAG: hypothetical protein AB7V08_03785 [Elusimicrobiales bacterium]